MILKFQNKLILFVFPPVYRSVLKQARRRKHWNAVLFVFGIQKNVGQ